MARSRAIIVACSILLSGCASIFEGTTQQISVNTTPAGARCTFWKNGGLIADIPSTPGAVTIRKSKDDLFIVCDKPGYVSASFVNRSGLAMATFANILTAGLAWAVDSSRGADNKYQGEVNLALVPAATPAPVEQPRAAPAPTAPEPVPQPRAGTPAPAQVPVAAPAPQQIECTASDGSRIRVAGSGCPAGWAVAR
ncbi:MAG: hypothetical protein E6G95_05995 [Alphaproteobacteria bacterium]|nr:MAG: hypothetical protein E6G95_05995 [Alphaproteobacteria bacterium]